MYLVLYLNFIHLLYNNKNGIRYTEYYVHLKQWTTNHMCSSFGIICLTTNYLLLLGVKLGNRFTNKTNYTTHIVIIKHLIN